MEALKVEASTKLATSSPKGISAEGAPQKRPRGRAPTGMAWNGFAWVNAGENLNETPPKAPAAKKSKKAMRELPEGWKSAADVSSGDTYYYHERHRVPTWDRPE